MALGTASKSLYLPYLVSCVNSSPWGPATVASILTGRLVSLSKKSSKSFLSGPTILIATTGLLSTLSSLADSTLKSLPFNGRRVAGTTER